MNYAALPKIDNVLKEVEHQIGVVFNLSVLTAAVRESVAELRSQGDACLASTREELFKLAVRDSIRRYQEKQLPSLRKVINATGIVLHTNLGRAPLAEQAVQAVTEAAHGYCNVELDLESGKRSSRYDHLVELLRELTGAEDAMAVNNNAAAVLLVLDTLARAGETVISRGQLVEIGESFRIHDVIARTGAILHEVGATNKTHLRDYEEAICEQTSCLLQVHQSNYVMRGFVEGVPTLELARLAHKHGLPLIYDLGSGCLYPFAESGIGQEPLPAALIRDGVDVLTFSGDKMLGGPQAGIIAGKKELLDRIKKNPLTRALRIDKLTVAALESTLRLYRNGRETEIPTVAMIIEPTERIKIKAEDLKRALSDCKADVKLRIGTSSVGGGSLPEVELPTWIVEIVPEEISAQRVLETLRKGNPAVLGYNRANCACFDLRAVPQEEVSIVAASIREILV